MVQVYADGFRDLPLREKDARLASGAGRDRGARHLLRPALRAQPRDARRARGDRHPRAATSTRATLDAIRRYTKLFWINTGPYNNLTARKFVLTCTPEAFAAAAHAAARARRAFPLPAGETLDALLERLAPMFFDPEFDPTVTSKTPPPGHDILTASANNLYAGVTMTDLDGFHEAHPLNSRLVKQDGRLVEEVYRVGGRYGAQIAAIVGHLEAALPFATEPMAKALRALIAFYQHRRRRRPRGVRHRLGAGQGVAGRHHQRLRRGLSWTRAASRARGKRSSATSIARRRLQIRTIAEQRAVVRRSHAVGPEVPKKRDARGVTANAIDVVIETGESGPMTPVGINLPNDQAIRERYGSKSVSLSNVNEAYDKSTLPEFRSEFSWTAEEAARATDWSAFAGELTTNMHEVIGHGSGKVDERLHGNPHGALKEQFSAIEESRADLVALYFLPDPKLVEFGLVPAGAPRGHRPRRVRGLHAQCARPAAARPRGHADRRRPHAQPPDDRALADGAHDRDRACGCATARPTT